jgi:sec-independent protein translocase protein TatA
VKGIVNMDIGLPEILIVLVIVIVIFGPGRIANLGGELGRSLREFREGLQGDQTDEHGDETQAAEKEDDNTPPE